MAISKIESASLATGVPSRSQLPAGTVLQVVQAVYTTDTTVSSSSYTDTGLSASITPTSNTSKVLVMINLQFRQAGSPSSSFDTQIVRNSTAILNDNASSVGSGELTLNSATVGATSGKYAVNYSDSPATNTSTTYKIQSKVTSGSSVRHQVDGAPSIITLMEIAA